MSVIFRKLAQNSSKTTIIRRANVQGFVLCYRQLSIVPSIYDGEQDPAPKFFSSNVQALLKRLTRPDLDKVFRKRNKGLKVLKTPVYKFLTDEELESEMHMAKKRADKLLQMPPVVKVHQSVTEMLSKDPGLTGYDTAKYLFTDISFGVDNAQRLIVERDTDGTLQACDHSVRKRLNQVYFPMNGRRIKEPAMFSDKEMLHTLLDQHQYEFVLDRACIQYEPDEHNYQEITSIVYQHVDLQKNYEKLRSTRHFGPLAFYLTWHQSIDNLMLELIHDNVVREAVVLLALRQVIHGDVQGGELVDTLTKQILPTPIQLTKPEFVTEEDIQLDAQCVDAIAKYIVGNSSMKSQQELALQGYREHYNALIELSRGLKKAHGNA